MKDPENNLKYGESSYTFKNIFNDYLNQHKKRKSQLELVLNPHKLFFEDLNKKRKKFDLQIDNMNILNDLFDGNIMDADQQKYLNYRPHLGFKPKPNIKKFSQFILFNKTGKLNNHINYKNKSMHKSFSQSNKNFLQFPKIISRINKNNKTVSQKQHLNINTFNFDEKFLRNKIKKNKEKIKTFFSNEKNTKKKKIKSMNLKKIKNSNNDNLKIFNTYKNTFFNNINLLKAESKKFSKDLSDFFLQNSYYTFKYN